MYKKIKQKNIYIFGVTRKHFFLYGITMLVGIILSIICLCCATDNHIWSYLIGLSSGLVVTTLFAYFIDMINVKNFKQERFIKRKYYTEFTYHSIDRTLQNFFNLKRKLYKIDTNEIDDATYTIYSLFEIINDIKGYFDKYFYPFKPLEIESSEKKKQVLTSIAQFSWPIEDLAIRLSQITNDKNLLIINDVFNEEELISLDYLEKTCNEFLSYANTLDINYLYSYFGILSDAIIKTISLIDEFKILTTKHYQPNK